MKLSKYLEDLNELVKHNPDILDYDVVYSHDDEGNCFQKVNYTGTIGYHDGEYHGEFYGKEDMLSYGIKEPNAVCIN